MARQGATVLIADVDAEGAIAAAAEISAKSGTPVEPATLDVRDRHAFAALVDRFVADHGTIGMLVNCAGVSVGGATHQLSGEHWDLAVDVNLGGTINGILASYPHMVRARSGHLVNIASGVGLAPAPFVAAYSASKHGVVGLSLSLRPEAALRGVQVSVVCPGAVETPILDRLPPDDLPHVDGLTAREYLAIVHQRPMRADRFAARALLELRRGRALIVIPRSTKALWLLQRLSPAVMQRVLASIARRIDRRVLRP
jgi:NAD(P)-dependent dehydrogenase (short-subunit alcohol dehydrogenase family)